MREKEDFLGIPLSNRSEPPVFTDAENRDLIWVRVETNIKRIDQNIGRVHEPPIKLMKIAFCDEFTSFKVNTYLPCILIHENNRTMWVKLYNNYYGQPLDLHELTGTLNESKIKFIEMVYKAWKIGREKEKRLHTDAENEKIDEKLKKEVLGGMAEKMDSDAKIKESFDLIVAMYKEALKRAEEHSDKRAQEILKTAENLIQDTINQAKQSAQEYIEKFVKERVPQRLEIFINGKKSGELPNGELRHAQFERVYRRAVARIPILLVGPTGSGKTHLGEQLARALNRKFYCTSITAGQSEGVLGGRLLPIGIGGKFEYIAAEFVKAYETGGVFGADEFDAGDANVLVLVNSALANGYMSVPNRPEAPVAQQHEDFVFVAMANTFCRGADRQYTARNELDTSTVNRVKMGTIFIDYDPILEEKLIHPSILKWGRAVREVLRTHSIRRVMSTRDMINAGKLMDVGTQEWDWKQSYYEDWKPDELAKVPNELKSPVRCT